MELPYRKTAAEKSSYDTENSPRNVRRIAESYSQPFVECHPPVSNFLLGGNSNLVIRLASFGHALNWCHRLTENLSLSLDFQIQWLSFGPAHVLHELSPNINFLSVDGDNLVVASDSRAHGRLSRLDKIDNCCPRQKPNRGIRLEEAFRQSLYGAELSVVQNFQLQLFLRSQLCQLHLGLFPVRGLHAVNRHDLIPWLKRVWGRCIVHGHGGNFDRLVQISRVWHANKSKKSRQKNDRKDQIDRRTGKGNQYPLPARLAHQFIRSPGRRNIIRIHFR